MGMTAREKLDGFIDELEELSQRLIVMNGELSDAQRKKRDLEERLLATRTWLASHENTPEAIRLGSEAQFAKKKFEEEEICKEINSLGVRESAVSDDINRIIDQIGLINNKKDELRRDMERVASQKNSSFDDPSLHGLSQVSSCIERRKGLLRLDGPIDAVYEPIALIGGVGVGKSLAVGYIARSLYIEGALASERVFKRTPSEALPKTFDSDNYGVIHVDLTECVLPVCGELSPELESIKRDISRVYQSNPHMLIVFECHPKSVDELLSIFDGAEGAFVRSKNRLFCEDLDSPSLLSILTDSEWQNGMSLESTLSARGMTSELCLTDGAASLLIQGFEDIRKAQGPRFRNANMLARMKTDLVAKAVELGNERVPNGAYLITDEVVRDVLSNGDWGLSGLGSSTREQIRASAMAELDSLVGMDDVKGVIEAIETEFQFNTELARACGADDVARWGRKPSFAFLGPAGTGKTTVARLMARLLYGIGICDTDKLVITSPNDLVAGYVGQSGPNAKRVIESAYGGVLFVDEAYNLEASGSSNHPGDFESAVIIAFLTAMTSEDANVVIVFAGYEDRMNRFFDSNEGLRSRITHYIHFKDYSPEDLAQIVSKKLKSKGLELDDDAVAPLTHLMKHVSTLGDRFANARGAERIAEEIKSEKAREWRRSGAADIQHVDSGTVRAVMRSYLDGVPEGDCQAHDCDGSQIISSPLSEVEAKKGGSFLLAFDNADFFKEDAVESGYKSLGGWIKGLKENALQAFALDLRWGSARMNDALEKAGYITPKPGRRFTDLALGDLDVKEEEREGKSGSYTILLYSREAFLFALNVYDAFRSRH